TFNPVSPGSVTAAPIEGGSELSGVSCPSSSQCTAVDVIGRERTFNPTSFGSQIPVPISTFQLNAIDCLSPSQCTAVDQAGQEATFDPTNPPASPNPQGVDSNGGLTSVSCVSTASQ